MIRGLRTIGDLSLIRSSALMFFPGFSTAPSLLGPSDRLTRTHARKDPSSYPLVSQNFVVSQNLRTLTFQDKRCKRS